MPRSCKRCRQGERLPESGPLAPNISKKGVAQHHHMVLAGSVAAASKLVQATASQPKSVKMFRGRARAFNAFGLGPIVDSKIATPNHAADPSPNA